jgi:hypothetical protein
MWNLREEKFGNQYLASPRITMARSWQPLARSIARCSSSENVCPDRSLHALAHANSLGEVMQEAAEL